MSTWTAAEVAGRRHVADAVGDREDVAVAVAGHDAGVGARHAEGVVAEGAADAARERRDLARDRPRGGVRPAPASLPSPSTKGIESALNTGPPVTVTEWPVGAVESSVTFSVVMLVFGGVQASRRLDVDAEVPGGGVRPAEGAGDVRAACGRADRLERMCSSRPGRRPGRSAEPGPEPPSTTALESVNEPAAAGR